MKYIRIKNGACAVNDEAYNIKYIIPVEEYDTKYFFRAEHIIDQADTIEELCDEFVYIKDGVINQYLTIDFKHKRDDEFCTLKNKLTANGIAEISKGISKYELQVGELKGAIWTDKGLIYVAKMNEEGEFELIWKD